MPINLLVFICEKGSPGRQVENTHCNMATASSKTDCFDSLGFRGVPPPVPGKVHLTLCFCTSALLALAFNSTSVGPVNQWHLCRESYGFNFFRRIITFSWFHNFLTDKCWIKIYTISEFQFPYLKREKVISTLVIYLFFYQGLNMVNAFKVWNTVSNRE